MPDRDVTSFANATLSKIQISNGKETCGFRIESDINEFLDVVLSRGQTRREGEVGAERPKDTTGGEDKEAALVRKIKRHGPGLLNAQWEINRDE